MIGMRVVKPEQLLPQLARARLRGAVIVRTHEEAPARTVFGRVRQRERCRDDAVAADERAAAFVGIGVAAVRFDCVDGGLREEPAR